jgi:hypothetical protein
MTFQYALRTSTGVASSQLGGYTQNHYSTTTRVVSTSSLARGLGTNNYSTWLLRLTWRRARGLNATSVLRWWLPQTLKTLGLILQSFQGSGATRLHPSVDFFKTEAESGLTLSQSLQLSLRLGGYSIWSALLQPHFHIISTSRLMSWTTFQPRGSSSTIEDFSKQYSRTLKNYSKRLQDYSNYYSRLQRARGLVGHTPRVPQGRKQTNS